MDSVVVTGLGAVTPVGLSAVTTWDAIRGGRSGIRLIEDEWARELPVRIAARVDEAFGELLDVRETRRLDRAEQFALVAGREAWKDAGAPQVDPTRLAVVVGTAIAGVATTVEQEHALSERGARHVSPHTATRMMANGASAWLSIEFGARAGAYTPVSACASGIEAIAMARMLILSGAADVVICGGTEAPVIPIGLAAFGQARALSKRNDEPQHASRPFDEHRDGFVLGEGAVVFVLESAAHAAARGAVVLAVAAGTAVTSDAFDIVGADPVNQARTMVTAMRNAGVEPEQIGFVHAHATSTPTGDQNEYDALREAFDSVPPVTSTKSATGHLLGASGALSALVAIRALRDGIVPPTGNIQRLDPAFDLDVVRTARPIAAEHALVNAFGFGGHNASLVVSRG
jgi:3-oxoacyl-[acyl-carrier-protein] synthase II